MSKEIIEYFDHEFVSMDDEGGNYFNLNLNVYECLKCKWKSYFLEVYIKENRKILSCEERIIKQILE